ncbi:MAG: cyclic nucleotide-binding domain-containing protein [Actinomycetota bacterium]|nr:cyclic nucleotide-binding domain-containing protein [Actinomycetota bacterium]
MRVQGSFTSISWIPSEAVKGMGRVAFDRGVTHYDDPPPDHVAGIDELVALRDADRFRFANDLRVWAEVEDGRIVDAGYDGGGLIGATTVRLGRMRRDFQAVLFPTIQHEPERGADRVRFVQTVGGRTGVPAPRRVNRPPFVQLQAPTVWTTLALTLHAGGTSTWDVEGQSPFPRHWFYDHDGALVAKSGLTEFEEWWRGAFGKHSPWGDEDSPALVTAAETALERALATEIMRGGEKPQVQEYAAGDVLLEQGAASDDVYLVLDGVVRADVDGEPLAEYGPGALLGERAVLEGGRRTATVTALTPTRVAVARSDQLDPEALAEVSQRHRHEEQT